MFQKICHTLTVLLLSTSVFALNDDKQNVPSAIAKLSPAKLAQQLVPFNERLLKDKIFKTLGLEVKSARPTAMLGLAEIVTNQGLFYASFDGDFLVQGKLYGLGENVTNLTEQSLAKVRVEGINRFADGMIVYPAAEEKHVITVFTDITCGYCRKMHEQMDAYNDNGITIRYLPYPRAGVMDNAGGFTQGFKDLRSIWCNEDPNAALTKAKAGAGVALRICDKPVEEEFNFARQVGVNATPAIITSSGMMFPGYRTPDDLLRMLESM
ncbi:thioredoxin fold domain-containing protein [Colwelliaceae bacterium 6471]